MANLEEPRNLEKYCISNNNNLISTEFNMNIKVSLFLYFSNKQLKIFLGRDHLQIPK